MFSRSESYTDRKGGDVMIQVSRRGAGITQCGTCFRYYLDGKPVRPSEAPERPCDECDAS